MERRNKVWVRKCLCMEFKGARSKGMPKKWLCTTCWWFHASKRPHIGSCVHSDRIPGLQYDSWSTWNHYRITVLLPGHKHSFFSSMLQPRGGWSEGGGRSIEDVLRQELLASALCSPIWVTRDQRIFSAPTTRSWASSPKSLLRPRCSQFGVNQLWSGMMTSRVVFVVSHKSLSESTNKHIFQPIVWCRCSMSVSDTRSIGSKKTATGCHRYPSTPVSLDDYGSHSLLLRDWIESSLKAWVV